MKCLKHIKDEKAMTIAEIIVSVFILALVAAVIMPGLLFGFKQVYESGNKSSKVYTIQKELEEKLITPGDDAVEATLTIKFGSQSFQVTGEIVEKEEVYDNRGSKTKAKVFIP